MGLLSLLRAAYNGPRNGIQAAANGHGPLSDYWNGPVPSRMDQSTSGVPVTRQKFA